MSSSGWGGSGKGPQGEPWQNGAGQNSGPHGGQPQWGQQPGGQPQPGAQQPAWGQQPGGQPQPGQPQPGPSQPGSPAGPGFGSPSGPAGPGGSQGSGWGPGSPQGPGQPPNLWGPGSPQDPNALGSLQAAPQRKRPWVAITIALACVIVLLLVVGGGITYLIVRQGGDSPVATGTPPETSTTDASESPSESPSATPEEAEPNEFEVVVPYDPPTGSADELWEVMETNPLTSGTLPTLSECELPATPIDASPEELQAVLDAASTCLNQVWSTASSDRNLPWTSPKIVVYEHPDIPKDATCDSNFSADFPRMCNLDSTLYWPIGYGIANDLSDPANVPGAYLWDLSYIYTNTVSWNSSLTVYYGTLRDTLEGSDDERFNEAWQRFTLQRECLASAAAMQVPTAAEPAPELREKLSDPGTWQEGTPPQSVTPENRAAWIERGFDSGGDLSQCNAWVADADQVA